MTPSAITPAARGTRRKPATAAAGPAELEPRRLERPSLVPRPGGQSAKPRAQTAPRAPRRVSGPLRGRTREQTVPAETRRPRDRRRARASVEPAAGARLLTRSAEFVRALPDHSLLDRIVRGRAWIPLIGVLLAGIVAMQVEVLKLNAGIGRSLVRGTALQSENALLRAQVATLADDQRIESKAAQMGMVMPSPGSIKFLELGRTVAMARALSSYHQPDPSAFASGLTAARAAASSPSAGSSASTATAAP